MWHPLIANLSEVKTDDLVTKMNDLSKRMRMTNNMYVRQQLVTLFCEYKSEYDRRINEQMRKESEKFDKIVNIE